MLYTCYYCHKRLPKEETKRCSRCLLVTYCSKECQTISWKSSHKQNCLIHPSLVSPADPTKLLTKSDLRKGSEEYNAVKIDGDLSKWMQYWRACFCTWALLALDLANHPKERVMTHCMTLCVQERPRKVADPFKRYEVVSVGVLPISVIQEDFPDLEVFIDPTDYTRLRYIVILQDEEGDMIRVRLVQWNQRHLDIYRNMDKGASAALGADSDDFADDLIRCVDTEDPQDVEKGSRYASNFRDSGLA